MDKETKVIPLDVHPVKVFNLDVQNMKQRRISACDKIRKEFFNYLAKLLKDKKEIA